MDKKQSEQRTCKLDLILLQYSGINTSYDGKIGLKRKCVLSGRVDDPYRNPFGDIQAFGEGDSAFHRKPVRVEISSPPDPELADEIHAELDCEDACGAVVVKAGVEPERFDFEGEIVEVEPVYVRIEVSLDAFEAICRQASEAYNHCRIMQAEIILSGKSIPNGNKTLFPSISSIPLKALDISHSREYAVSAFEIFNTRYIDHLRGRVLQVERGRDEGYGTYIAVQLTDVRYTVDAARADVHSISCQGHILGSRGKPYDGIDVTIDFAEHESNEYGELPKRAFFGEFGYYPKPSDKSDSYTFFDFSLRHIPEDAWNFLIPILSQEVGMEVILKVELTTKETDLLTATDTLRGNVRNYRFEVQRQLRHSP